MKFKKNKVTMFIVVAGSIFVILFSMLHLPVGDDQEYATFRPHLMVNNQIYWYSDSPYGSNLLEENFVYIGKVEEVVPDSPKENYQGHNIEKDSEIYYNHRIPQIIYIASPSSTTLSRYATTDASKDYVYYNHTVYVSMSTLCGWDRENYKSNYVPIYGDQFTVDRSSNHYTFVGYTKFIGYNMFVSEELETNAFYNPATVYKNCDGPNSLCVGENNMLYVPVMQS